jgi:hypothetical protein
MACSEKDSTSLKRLAYEVVGGDRRRFGLVDWSCEYRLGMRVLTKAASIN